MVISNVDTSAGIPAPRKLPMQSAGFSDDLSLIREVQRGNREAFERLVYAHDQGVLWLALRITGSQADAQDIYQETFLRALKKLTSFRFECTFSTWIYRIATNVCLDHLRRKHTRKETSTTEVNADGEEYGLLNQVQDDRPASNPEQWVLGRELGTHVLEALTKLTPRERMIFELKHYQGLKLWTVSEILNCSEATTKSSLFRATQKLRRHLADSHLGRVVRRGTR